LIILAISAPIPAGVFAPSFCLGAVFGRLYGHMVKEIGLSLGYNLIKCKISERDYNSYFFINR
jgi:H+/Cl- antiporter ClcA